MTRDGDVRHGAVSRRTALKSAAGLAGGALATGVASAQSDGPDFGGWFENVSNFDGVVDRTGQSRVTVTVGAEGNNGNLAFGPAAIRVDPGTTVVWKWNGKGGAHNVVASDGSYRSGAPVQGSDVTFEHTFESEGVSKYYCAPHKQLGMKGAVVVGGGGASGPTRPTGIPPSLFAFGGVLFVLMLTPLIFGAFLRYRYPEGIPEEVATGESEPEPAVEAAGPLERVAEHIGHDEFEPTGTLTLVLVYMAILVVMWVFMYFVEFLGGGPTVIG